MMQALRGARAKMSGRLLLSQWVGNFVLMLLAAAWLQIPDSHSWQFAFSMLSGVLLVAGFLLLYTATFHHLRPCAEPAPRWLSWLLLAGFIALWWLVLQGIAAGRAHEALYAGYWNSQSPPWLRHLSVIPAWSHGKSVSMTACNAWSPGSCCPWSSCSAPAGSTRGACGMERRLISTGSTGWLCWSVAWGDRRSRGLLPTGHRMRAWWGKRSASLHGLELPTRWTSCCGASCWRSPPTISKPGNAPEPA